MRGGPTGFAGSERRQHPGDTPEGRADASAPAQTAKIGVMPLVAISRDRSRLHCFNAAGDAIA
jgi:hypothetical protein